jgi:hypothetical protein
MASPKAGSYPFADRANLFGTLYMSFYDRWNSGGNRDQCWPTFEGILGIAWSKADQKFKDAYEKVAYKDGKPRELTIQDMSSIVREAWALMDRIGTYDYTGSEFADEMEDVTVDLVSEKTVGQGP